MDPYYPIFIATILLVLLVLKAIHIVPEGYEWIVEDLGKKRPKPLKPGVILLLPFYSTVRAKILMREQVLELPPQAVYTSDHICLCIDTVLFFRIVDSMQAYYNINQLEKSIACLAQTALRNIISQMTMNDTFCSRDVINNQLRETLNHETKAWGCNVNLVEIKDINPPKDIRDAMEKQMIAEREKRAAILRAEAEKINTTGSVAKSNETTISDSFAESAASALLAEAKENLKKSNKI